MQKIGNTGTGMHVKLKPSENANEVFICADHVDLFVEMSSRAKILEIHYMKCVNSIDCTDVLFLGSQSLK